MSYIRKVWSSPQEASFLEHIESIAGDSTGDHRSLRTAVPIPWQKWVGSVRRQLASYIEWLILGAIFHIDINPLSVPNANQCGH